MLFYHVRGTITELYHGRDAFEFCQGHLTENQPMVVPVYLSKFNYIIYKGDWSYHTDNRQDKNGRRIGCKRPLEQEWNQIDEWQHTQP